MILRSHFMIKVKILSLLLTPFKKGEKVQYIT
jgi:hypothetical protein